MANTNMQNITKEQQEYLTGNLWKVVLKIMVPTIIMMLFFGIYSFSDTIIAINFADDSYADGDHNISGVDQVRMFMGAISPVNMLMMGVIFMAATGVATRVAVNQGAGKDGKALDTLKVGVTISMVASLVLIPVLILASKPWIASTIEQEANKDWVADNAFEYVWPLIVGLPFQLFAQQMTALFRNEGRNKEMMLAMIVPIFLNISDLTFILMGPAGMNIMGGAWATTISNFVSAMMFVVFIIIYKGDTILTIPNMFGIKLKYIFLVGIFLVGIGAFFGNFGMSLTTTLESRVVQSVSDHAYNADVINSWGGATEVPNPSSGLMISSKDVASMQMYIQLQTSDANLYAMFPISILNGRCS